MSVLIYKITSQYTKKLYIGQTQESLKTRLSRHKQEFKNLKRCSSRELLIYSDAKIEELEKCDYAVRKQRELYWINRYGDLAVNKQKPTRTYKEWYNDNREKVAKKNKEYREANKEKLKQKKLEYSEANKEVINEKKRNYYYNNKEECQERLKNYYQNNKDKWKSTEKSLERRRELYQQNKDYLNAKKRHNRSEFGMMCRLYNCI